MKHNMIQTKKAAIISARSSDNLDKYEYLTGEDLKPNTIEQARFEYSPLGKGLSEDGKKEGLFKKLKNIENAQKNVIKDENKKNQNQLKMKNNQKYLKIN